MEKTFLIQTIATVVYNNYCTIKEELWNEYKEEYPDATDEELARIIFYDCVGDICDYSEPISWDNEEVINVKGV